MIKNRSLIHFTIGSILSIMMIILFSTLFSINGVGTFGSNFTRIESSGMTFGISLFLILIIYSITTILNLHDTKKIKNLIFSLLITSLMMASIITIGELGYYMMFGEQVTRVILVMIMAFFFGILLIFIVIIAQVFNTKFLLISISNSRADEWEYSNFIELFFLKATIKHKENFSYLNSRKVTLVIKFIIEDEKNEKIFLSGDTTSLIIKDLESKINNNEKGAIVYLSNELPQFEGEHKNIKLIKDSELFKYFRSLKK